MMRSRGEVFYEVGEVSHKLLKLLYEVSEPKGEVRFHTSKRLRASLSLRAPRPLCPPPLGTSISGLFKILCYLRYLEMGDTFSGAVRPGRHVNKFAGTD